MSKQFCVFSKHFQWLSVAETAAAAAEVGFDGLDLAVRPGGHVDPDEVKTELPRAIRAIEATGLSCPMMVTSIVDPQSPQTEAVLRTAADCGVRYYRFGYLDYGENVAASLDDHREALARLAELNQKIGIHGAYQNHAGLRVGAPVWDIWELIRDLDPHWIGCQYDVRHAVIEGGTSWPIGMRLLSDYIRCIAVKDGAWIRHDDGSYAPTSVPIGDGMVDWKRFRSILNASAFQGAISVHYEYPLFSEDPRELSKSDLTTATIHGMRADLDSIRAILGGR